MNKRTRANILNLIAIVGIYLVVSLLINSGVLSRGDRCGNGTEYARISAVAPGSTFPHVATAQNGWHALVIGSRVGWVSGKFAKII